MAGRDGVGGRGMNEPLKTFTDEEWGNLDKEIDAQYERDVPTRGYASAFVPPVPVQPSTKVGLAYTPAPTQVSTIAAQTSTALDTATTYVVQEITTLIKELEDLKAYVIADGARVKSEVQGHVGVASEAVQSVADIRKRMDEMKRQRTIQMQMHTERS